MNNDVKIYNGKEMRFGYTTGTCATAAAKACTKMLLENREVTAIMVLLPSGRQSVFELANVRLESGYAQCSVKKDAGDDPDVTHGADIFARCELCEQNITIYGGEGVGVVTQPGLACAVGGPAINPGPRKMILKNVSDVCYENGYTGGVTVTISVPGGEEIAKRTFNARLGITGGISILGSTGVVEPMSQKALIDTTRLLIDKQYLIDPENILISPGNYGQDYCKQVLNIDIDKGVKYSNFLGETLDYILYKGFKNVLIVGHAGKLVKVAGGIMDTHSSSADCRMEIIAAHAAYIGAKRKTVRLIMDAMTTDAAVDVLSQDDDMLHKDMLNKVFARIVDKMLYHMNYRTKCQLNIEVFVFSAGNTIIAKSRGADYFIRMFSEGTK